MHSSSFNYGINLGSVQTHIFQFTLLFSSLYYFVPWLKSERLYCHNGSLLAGSSGEMSCLIELNISQMGCVSKILCHQIWQFIGPLFVFLAQERRMGPLKHFKTRRLLLQSVCWFIYKGRSNVSPIIDFLRVLVKFNSYEVSSTKMMIPLMLWFHQCLS